MMYLEREKSTNNGLVQLVRNLGLLSICCQGRTHAYGKNLIERGEPYLCTYKFFNKDY